MQKILRHTLIATLAAASLGAWAQSPSRLKVEDAWVRGTVAQQKATGAFMRLTAERELRLLSARSPVAGVVEIHEMAMEGDVMKMRQIPGLDLAAGRTMELKPGGYHVMLMDLKGPLAKDTNVTITLKFKDSKGVVSQQEVKLPVKEMTYGLGKEGGTGSAHKH